MSEKNKTLTLELTLLTPLHIGDGEELYSNIDFIVDKNTLKIIDIDDFLAELKATNPQAISEIAQSEFNLHKFILNYHLNVTPKYTLLFNGRSKPSSVRNFIKNAYGQPYVPGSSLKGALCTALWTTLPRCHVASAKDNYRVFKNETNNLAGSPHEHLLRPLQVSDSQTVSPDESLMVCEIKFFNLKNNAEAGWKNFASRQKETVTDFTMAGGIYVEALKQDTRVFVQIGLDSFLLAEPVRRLGRIKQCSALKDFSSMANVINQHSLRIVRRELEFFSRYKEGNRPALFYKKLENKIKELIGSRSFIIRLAWGSGWRGMTGDWLDDEEVKVVRKAVNLGKTACPLCKSIRVRKDKKDNQYVCLRNGCGHRFSKDGLWLFPEFPKTRRLAMHNGFPCLPLGWVMVRPMEKEAFLFHRPIDTKSSTESNPSSRGHVLELEGSKND
ncbi:type III-A CRISPR-associated RAMP protein Csm5 [Desulfovulcanus sp.]